MASSLDNITAAAAKSLQSCPTLCDRIDGSPPGSAVPGIPYFKNMELEPEEILKFSIRFPDGSGNLPTMDEGDLSSIPGLGISPGGENSNPLQYSCLENPMDRGTWWATIYRVAEFDMPEQLNTHVQEQTPA